MFIENKLDTIRFAAIKDHDVANGPGVRVSLFVQGCPHHCHGCFNAETWDFDGGEIFTKEHLDTIIEIGNRPHISGLSILGGEPFAQNLDMLYDIVYKFKKYADNKPVWIWSGYLFEDLVKNDKAREVLEISDVLVDGPFIESLKDLTLLHRGSSNQRVIDLKEPGFWG